jgi:AbrB family looped-hinge helix DNA binding protein
VAPSDIADHFHGAVTVGERGQVVIPASVREALGISAGDKLLVFAHPSGSGVLFTKLQDLQRMTELIGAALQQHNEEPPTVSTPQEPHEE